MSPVEIAVSALKGGGIVAFPTDTYYGLGANVFDERAVERVLEAKGRPPSSPLPVLLADADDIGKVCQDPPPELKSLAEAFWPGPLTLVAPSLESVAKGVTAGRGTVGCESPTTKRREASQGSLGVQSRVRARISRGMARTRPAAPSKMTLGKSVDYVVPGECGATRPLRRSSICAAIRP